MRYTIGVMAWRRSEEDEIERGDITFREEDVEHDFDFEEDDEQYEDYELSPDDPDYDLSEAAGYSAWEPRDRPFPIAQWLIIAVSLLLILALVLPVVLRFS